MKKRKHVLLIVIFAILGVLLVVGALFAVGVFSPSSIDISDVTKPEPETLTPGSRTVMPSVQSLFGELGGGETMNGVWFDLSADLGDPSTAEEAMSEIYSDFLYMRNVAADTVFVRPDSSGRFDKLKNTDGTAFDVMSYVLLCAADQDCHTVLAVDESVLLRDGKLTLEQLFALLTRYPFDAVLLTPANGTNGEDFYRCASFLMTNARQADPSACLGLDLYSVPGASPVPVEAVALLRSQQVDFVCVSCGAAGGSTLPFAQDVAAWNAAAAEFPDIAFYCVHSLGKKASADFINQVKTLFEQEIFCGSIYRSVAGLKNSPSVTLDISRLCYGDDKDSGFEVSSLQVEKDGRSVVFGGVAREGEKLICNRTVIDPDGGPFALACQLQDGKNTFTLKNGGYSVVSSIECVPDAKTTENQQKPSPYTDNGKGRALMCRVDSDRAQSVAVAGDYDTFRPQNSDLPGGTLDYVRAITYDEEGMRYELESGLNVYASNCTLLTNAYAMPVNHIACVESDDDDARYTKLVFSTDWFVPVNISCLPQEYAKGYMSFSYNIAAFTADHLEVTFHHTDSVSGIDSLSFGDSSVVTGCETVKNDENSTVLRLPLRNAGCFYGAYISFDVNGNIVLTIKKRPVSLTSAKVMLDPGHGGVYMTGTALNDQSLSEKEVTLDLAKKVASMLRAQGVEVRMTREADFSLTLWERRQMCREYDPDVFVSIHCDGVDDMGKSGTHSFYFKSYSQPLAASVHSKLVDVYSNVIYTSIDKNYDQIDKSIKYYPFYVTRVDNCPSILVESGFMSNDFEGKILADENCRNWIADAITAGIVAYLTQ